MSRISKKKIEPVIQFVKKDNLNYMVYEAYEKRPNNIEYKYCKDLVVSVPIKKLISYKIFKLLPKNSHYSD